LGSQISRVYMKNVERERLEVKWAEAAAAKLFSE
jgi:hypothetical protein